MLKSISDPRGDISQHGRIASISGYAAQAHLHTDICNAIGMRWHMSKTPDQRREILRRFIAERGLKIATWAKQSGVDKNSIYNFLNSHSQALDPRTYAKLARTAQVPVWRISGDEPDAPSPTTVWVSGSVEAGAFREAVEWDRHEWFPVDVPVPSRFQGKCRALQVRGTSMNIEYPEGSIAIWVKMLDFRPVQDGDDVVVYSHHRDGKVESTLKQYREDERGLRWLWPRSHDPLHQAPVNTQSPPDEIASIEVVGIVVGMYRPKHF